jgi:deoxycytidine triphosphate deaminase
MFINPNIAISNGWITFPKWVTDEERAKYIQPNAIDFTMDNVQMIDKEASHTYGISLVRITETDKKMPQAIFVPQGEDGVFRLAPDEVYDVMSDFYVDVPVGVCAMLYLRSTFSRCGVRLSSGLYDTGFKGNIGCTLVNHGVTVTTQLRTRVGQIAFLTSDSAKEYAGGWNTANGQHWSELKA